MLKMLQYLYCGSSLLENDALLQEIFKSSYVEIATSFVYQYKIENDT